MRLKKLSINNFRGYQDEVNIPISNLTTFIGRNDIGKSTILEALEIFFNNKLVQIDIDDLNKQAYENGADEIVISCIFDNLPNEIVVDANKNTTFDNEFLLNSDGDLEIVKKYKVSGSKLKENVYIRCNHPKKEQYNDLLVLKNNDLKKRAQELQIDPSLYNASINVELRNAIWRNIPKSELELSECFIQVDKEGGKEIYGQIQKFLPIYALFQSDRPSKDDDPEVVDPMKLAIISALKGVEVELDKIKQQVQEAACETANRTLDKLKEMAPEIANNLIPEFKSAPKFDSLFKMTIKSDENIPINKRGSGVRRLILLNFFRAEVERRMMELNCESIIYAFEEPETSQHPKHQMILLEAFQDLSLSNNCQVIFTTHTPALASCVPVEGLRFVDEVDNQKTIKCTGEDMFSEICDELGILPEPISANAKGIILVEGKDDVTFARYASKKLSEGGYLTKDLVAAGFVFIPIFGCDNLKHWRSKKLIEQFRLPWGILLDSDRGAVPPTKNMDKIQRLVESGAKAYCTKKREIENYIDVSVIPDYSGPQLTDTIDAKKAIADNSSIKKTEIIDKVWCNMSVEQIRDAEKYIDDDGNEHFEFTEMFEDFLSLLE